MFERAIFTYLKEGIDELTTGVPGGAQPTLRRLFGAPLWEDAEIDKLVTYWNSPEGAPTLVHGYPRLGAKLPCYSIVLGSEVEDRHYLNDDPGEAYDAAREYIAEVEAELGRTVQAKISRWTVNYPIYVYGETPDVTLAYYNVLRSIMLKSHHKFIEVGLNEPDFSGQDLMADPRFQGDNVVTRVFTVKGWTHVLYTEDLNLGPLAIGRGTRIARVHVADSVLGVNPGVTPVDVGE